MYKDKNKKYILANVCSLVKHFLSCSFVLFCFFGGNDAFLSENLIKLCGVYVYHSSCLYLILKEYSEISHVFLKM